MNVCPVTGARAPAPTVTREQHTPPCRPGMGVLEVEDTRSQCIHPCFIGGTPGLGGQKLSFKVTQPRISRADVVRETLPSNIPHLTSTQTLWTPLGSHPGGHTRSTADTRLGKKTDERRGPAALWVRALTAGLSVWGEAQRVPLGEGPQASPRTACMRHRVSHLRARKATSGRGGGSTDRAQLRA